MRNSGGNGGGPRTQRVPLAVIPGPVSAEASAEERLRRASPPEAGKPQ
jgi:hypothetical protein